jgi:hypothetical protein
MRGTAAREPSAISKAPGRYAGLSSVARAKGVERELIVFFVVGDVAAGGLRGEPFADVALVGTGFVGEFFGSEGIGGEGLVESEFFADDNHASMNRSTEVADKTPHKSVEFIHIQGRPGSGAHDSFSPVCGGPMASASDEGCWGNDACLTADSAQRPGRSQVKSM